MQSLAINSVEIEKQLEPFSEAENIVGLEFYGRSRFVYRMVQGEQCLVFGSNETSYICLSPATGKIWFADDENEPQFVNSSFDKFVQCLSKHKEFFSFAGNEDSKLHEAGQKLKKFIKTVDAPALQDNNFWAMITEELETLHAPAEELENVA